jgi:two-component system, sensor histidine kinase and response regulator
MAEKNTTAYIRQLESRVSVLEELLATQERTVIEQSERLEGAREGALAASKAKSEFLSSMSHEIRTPMNAVLGMADLLSETELSVEQRRYLEVMIANGNSLLELINGILDLARIESGRLQIEKVEFDLTELIDKTISTFGVQAHTKNLELVARIGASVPERLVGDPLRLRQVLINLLGNAIKFTELGEVILEVERNSESNEHADLRFSVSDTGIGIPSDQLGVIFSSFTQADSSTTRKHGGTGLGLAIAQRLVGLFGGQIRVESEMQKGSRFSFTAKFGLAPRVISPTAHVVLSLVGHRVLVVDDNRINRMIVREMISTCGAEVTEAESGEEALAAIHRATDAGLTYRIILLDMRMPGMDGLEVAQRIRQAQLPVEPVILMLSSDDLRPQLTRLKQLGLDAYLVKPVTRKELFEAIRRVIEDANRNSATALPERRPPEIRSEQAACFSPVRILVAEDAPDNRLVVKAYLRREPYEIDFAEDGQEAVEKFTSHKYDLVLMDIQMPRMDGLAATRKIRQWETEHALPPVPIIALTASVLDEDVRCAVAAGCNLHIGKPVKKRALLDTIRNAALLARHEVPILSAADPTPLVERQKLIGSA